MREINKGTIKSAELALANKNKCEEIEKKVGEVGQKSYHNLSTFFTLVNSTAILKEQLKKP